MKIAVATVDGINLSQHFGQSIGFVIFEVENKQVLGQEVRTYSASLHDMMHCDPASSAQPVRTLPELLGDCEVVLVGGIGAGAVEKLKQAGKRSVVVNAPATAEFAVISYLHGEPMAEGTATCGCHH